MRPVSDIRDHSSAVDMVICEEKTSPFSSVSGLV